VISWFQAFAFKWVNLYRYGEGFYDAINAEAELVPPGGGLYNLNPIDPELETAAFFQPLNLKCEKLVSQNFAFSHATFVPLRPGCEGLVVQEHLQGNRTPHTDPLSRGVVGGAVQAESSCDPRLESAWFVQPFNLKCDIVSSTISTACVGD
jgi:hypothetical protein